MYLPKKLRAETSEFSNPQPPHPPLCLHIKEENSNVNLILKFFTKRRRCYGNVII